MRLRLTLALVTLWGALVSAPAAIPLIRAADVLEHVKFLADDEFKGRASGTPELERAAEYIASQFKSAGLEPGIDGDWFQPFELDAGITIGADNALSVASNSRQVTLTLGRSYFPLAAPANSNSPSTTLTDVPLVFAGYGISSPGLRYDDYAGLDVRGKAVIVFSHEPQERSRESRLNGSQAVPESSLYAKATAARTRGAVAVLVVSDPAHQADTADYESFAVAPDAEDLGIAVLRVRRSDIDALLVAWGLDQLARLIDGDLTPRSRPLTGATIRYSESLTRNRRTVRNVVGVLRAQGPRRHEALVIGAHYDHVGLGGRYSTVPERSGEIHNGADDNASGTAAIIEMAKAATADRARFPRTLIFVAFTAEERGLLGSSHYVRNPTVPITDTVAMLNLDMVGRLRRSVDVSGLEAVPSLRSDLDAAARSVGIRYRQEGPGAGRSDDFPFLEAGAPAINFFTGFHAEYHHPADDWPRINADGTARVAQFALELAARIAERPTRPPFTPPPR